MMVLVGGKERSLSEFRELAGAAGLEVTAAKRQASGRFVVECTPGSFDERQGETTIESESHGMNVH